MAKAAPAEEGERHRGLRFFLLGVRVIGVIAALLVSNFHSHPIALGEELIELSWLVTSGVLFYHFMAGLMTGLSQNKALGSVIILLDVLIGTATTYVYGEAYFLLVFALPVLEICASFGLTASLVTGVLGLMFYGVVYARPLLDSFANNTIDTKTLTLRLSLSGIQAAVAVLMTWLYSIAIAEGNRVQGVREESERTTELLYQQLADRTTEVERIYSEMGGQESRVAKLTTEVTHLTHDLEEAYKDIAKARMAINTKQDMAEETVTKISDEMERSRSLLEEQAIRLEKELDNRTRTLEGFRQVSGSLSLEETLLALAFHVQSRLPSQVCVVFMKEDVQGQKYLYPEVADAADPDFFRELAIPVGEQSVGWVGASGRTLNIQDTSVENDAGVFEVLAEQGRSALILPIRDPGSQEVLGVVYLGRTKPHAYHSQDLTMLEGFLELASVAIVRCLEFRHRVGGGLHDPVTGLHNGMYLAERMEEEVRRGRRYSYPVSLLLVDIDNFTPMLERLNAEVIDNILRQVAGLVLEAIRDTDVAARVEGDDFAILLVHSDRDSAVPIGERIRQEVSQTTFGSAGQPLRLTVSVGVAGVPHDASDAQRLKDVAFGAIAEARASGGNRVCIFPR